MVLVMPDQGYFCVWMAVHLSNLDGWCCHQRTKCSLQLQWNIQSVPHVLPQKRLPWDSTFDLQQGSTVVNTQTFMKQNCIISIKFCKQDLHQSCQWWVKNCNSISRHLQMYIFNLQSSLPWYCLFKSTKSHFLPRHLFIKISKAAKKINNYWCVPTKQIKASSVKKKRYVKRRQNC